MIELGGNRNSMSVIHHNLSDIDVGPSSFVRNIHIRSAARAYLLLSAVAYGSSCGPLYYGINCLVSVSPCPEV